jgi:hypothetical protein
MHLAVLWLGSQCHMRIPVKSRLQFAMLMIIG